MRHRRRNLRLRRALNPSRQHPPHSLRELAQRARAISLNPADVLHVAGEMIREGVELPAGHGQLSIHGLPIVADPRIPPGMAALVSASGNQLELIHL